MKARHRHQLETNELADRLGRFIATVRPYTSYALAAAVLVVGWYAYTSIQSRRVEARQRLAWASLQTAAMGQHAGKLVEVAHEFSEMPVRPLALLMAADVTYRQGLEGCVRDYPSAEQKWREALSRYQEVLQAPGATRWERARAQLGVGRCHESLVQFSRARPTYEMVVKDYPKSLQAEEAKKRLKSLADSDVVVNFYRQLRSQKRVEPTPLPGATTQQNAGAVGAGAERPREGGEAGPQSGR